MQSFPILPSSTCVCVCVCVFLQHLTFEADACRDRSPVMQPFPHPSVQVPPYSGSIAELSFARPESGPSSHEHPHGSQHTPKGPYRPPEMPLPNGSQGLEHFQFLPGQMPRGARPCFNADPRANPSVVSRASMVCAAYMLLLRF